MNPCKKFDFNYLYCFFVSGELNVNNLFKYLFKGGGSITFLEFFVDAFIFKLSLPPKFDDVELPGCLQTLEC